MFGGANVDGARGKWPTIKKVIIETKADVWMMQETKCETRTLKKLDKFILYEHLRSEGGGGGLAFFARKDLNPALLRDGGDEADTITVDIHVQKMTISCTNAYGPQETAKTKTKDDFWKYLDDDAKRADKDGKGFLLQGDMNSWLGPKMIPGDKRKQNNNGKRFAMFVKSNNLTVVNSLSICEGLITRSRMRQGKLIQSTIDFYVVCQRVLPYVTHMKIDSDKKYNLTNFKPVSKGRKAIDADHVPLILKIDLKISPSKPEKIEILNFKNLDGLKKFLSSTEENDDFSRCFSNGNKDLKQVSQWKQVYEKKCKQSFPKIRIKSKKIQSSNADKLIN